MPVGCAARSDIVLVGQPSGSVGFNDSTEFTLNFKVIVSVEKGPVPQDVFKSLDGTEGVAYVKVHWKE
jgi:hypothetical protein